MFLAVSPIWKLYEFENVFWLYQRFPNLWFYFKFFSIQFIRFSFSFLFIYLFFFAGGVSSRFLSVIYTFGLLGISSFFLLAPHLFCVVFFLFCFLVLLFYFDIKIYRIFRVRFTIHFTFLNIFSVSFAKKQVPQRQTMCMAMAHNSCRAVMALPAYPHWSWCNGPTRLLTRPFFCVAMAHNLIVR